MTPNTVQDSTKPVLIFTWGNPSRGDDALGTQAYDLLGQENFVDVDLLTDFQLQIEHAIDLESRERVLFIDASANAEPPFEFYQLFPTRDDSYTTHAMSPQSILAVYERIQGKTAPKAFMLSIRGYEFGLGLPLSEKAAENLSEAVAYIRHLLTETPINDWTQQTRR
ncbi:MAG: hydrogenase maturation protease [Gammaproteobacteria bacterium]|jgi:hydrogenase maturation protease